jgi:diguanylate cyclase (GGDEF)-like protein
VRRGSLVIVIMWVLGLSSLVAVLSLQDQLDQRRRAQVTVADLRLQMNELPRVSLDINRQFTQAEVRAQLRAREENIVATARKLDHLSGSRRDSLLIVTGAREVFRLLDRANAISSRGQLKAATESLGLSLIPGSPGFELNATLDRISSDYDRQAADARRLADLGSAIVIVLVLIAFTVVLHRATRLAGEKQDLLEQSRRDALTDQLTGLWNRRKLFSDLELLLERTQPSEKVVIGMYDLDGFKAYNDMFGHPDGDALLARLGQRLASRIGGAGSAYRMGGDEFCVIARGADAEALLERARESLSERGEGYGVSCSLGTIAIAPGEMTPAEAFRKADQRLYDDKRSSRATLETGAADGAAEPPDEASVFAAA